MEQANATKLLLKIRDLANEYLQSLTKGSQEDESTFEVALGQLPWRAFERGPDNWIFSNEPDAKELRSRLEENGGKVQIGRFLYQFSGNKRFITRHELKEG